MKSDSWLAAQVKAKQEFSVSSALLSKGYETFVPTYSTLRKWSDRQKVCSLPLISGYVFVRTMPAKAHGPVVSTPGVLRMVGFGGEIAPIEDGDIQRIKTVVNSSLKTEPWSYVRSGLEVRIARGALAGIPGTVLQVKENTLLVVSVEMLQRSVAVHIDRSWVEPVRAASNHGK